MRAPLENIHGVAADSMEGTLQLDLSDLSQSTGLVKTDLLKLEIFQRKREAANEDFGEETKNPTQNEHMRDWLQIGDDAPEDARERFRWVEFRIARVSDVSNANVMEMEGAERTVQLTAHGELRLHGRTPREVRPPRARLRLRGRPGALGPHPDPWSRCPSASPSTTCSPARPSIGWPRRPSRPSARRSPRRPRSPSR